MSGVDPDFRDPTQILHRTPADAAQEADIVAPLEFLHRDIMHRLDRIADVLPPGAAILLERLHDYQREIGRNVAAVRHEYRGVVVAFEAVHTRISELQDQLADLADNAAPFPHYEDEEPPGQC